MRIQDYDTLQLVIGLCHTLTGLAKALPAGFFEACPGGLAVEAGPFRILCTRNADGPSSGPEADAMVAYVATGYYHQNGGSRLEGRSLEMFGYGSTREAAITALRGHFYRDLQRTPEYKRGEDITAAEARTEAAKAY